MENSVAKKSAMSYGLYLGISLILITVLVYSLNIGLFVEWWFTLFLFIGIVIFGVMSALKSRKILGGFISFKDAFTSYFITVFLGLLLSTIVSFLLFNVIDPEATQVLQEKIIDSSVQMMEKFGAPQDAIDEAVAKMAQENQFSLGKQLTSLAFQLIFYAVIGLIVALATKKNNPELE